MRRLALLLTALALGGGAAIAAEPPPIFVLLVDTVRADALRSFNPSISVGEQIDRLARDGVVFEAARSSSSWTRTAVATLLTGLPERTHKVYERGDVLGEQIETLAERLKPKGYRSAAWSANPNILRVWGFAQGFDSFQDVGATSWPKHKAHAAEILAGVRSALRDAPAGPRLYYLHFMDAHGPYQPDEADLDAVRADPHLSASFPGDASSGDGEQVRGDYQRYLAEIVGLDRQLGAFLEELRRSGIYDRAVLLLIADHGEEFLDHGGTEHGKTLYEEMLRVPAILKLPQQKAAGTRIAAPVAMMDFAPTLLRLAGVEPSADLPGVALWNGSEIVSPPPRAALASLRLDQFDKRAVADGGWKLIEERDDSAELFHLDEDPKERNAQRDATRTNQLRGVIAEADARGQEGWHLRYCGPALRSAVGFRLYTSAPVRGTLLEPGDSVSSSNGSVYVVKLALNKAKSAGTETSVADEDEIWIGDGAGTSTEIRGRARYSLGRSDKVQALDVLRLDSSTANAELAGGASCADPVDDASLAYFRVWHVGAAPKRAEEEVDPAVRERMRALGY